MESADRYITARIATYAGDSMPNGAAEPASESAECNRPANVWQQMRSVEKRMERARLELATFRLQTECSPN